MGIEQPSKRNDQHNPLDQDPDATLDGLESVDIAIPKLTSERSERFLLPGESNLTFRSIAKFLSATQLTQQFNDTDEKATERGWHRVFSFYTTITQSFPPSKYLSYDARNALPNELKTFAERENARFNDGSVNWREVQKGAFMYAMINGGHKAEVGPLLRFYMNVDPHQIIAFLGDLSRQAHELGIAMSAKTSIKSPHREDATVLYVPSSSALRIAQLVQKQYQLHQDWFIPTAALAFGAQVKLGEQVLPGVRIGQEPDHDTISRKKMSFHRLRDEAMDRAILDARKSKAVQSKKIPTKSANYIPQYQLRVLDEQAWETCVRDSLIRSDVDPERPYLNYHNGPKVLSVVKQLIGE